MSGQTSGHMEPIPSPSAASTASTASSTSSASAEAATARPSKRFRTSDDSDSDSEEAPTPKYMYTVIRTEGYHPDRFHSYIEPEERVIGSYVSGKEAYAVAIARQIWDMENLMMGEEQEELREIAHDASFGMDERYKNVRRYIEETDWWADSEEIKYAVKGAWVTTVGDFDDEDYVDDERLLGPNGNVRGVSS